MQTKPQTSWWQRNWKWFVPTLVLGTLAAFAGFIYAIFFLVHTMMTASAPYQFAMQAAGSNPQVQVRLGTPLESGFLISGNISTSGSSGEADLSIPVHGPAGEGTIHVVAERSGGVWQYSRLDVVIAGDVQRIDLLP